MTIWLSKPQVELELETLTNTDVSAEIEQTQNSERIRITAELSNISLNSLDFSQFDSFLTSISDGDPEVHINPNGSTLKFSVEANKNVYQEGF